MKKNNPIPFYPLLMAVFPALSLLGHNIQEISARGAVRSLLVCSVLALLVWAVCRLLARSWQLAAVLTAWFLLLFFSYGSVHTAIEGAQILGVIVGRHRILLPVWGLLLLGGGALILWKLRVNPNLTRILNAVSVFLLIMPLYQIASYNLRAWQSQRQLAGDHTVQAASVSLNAPEELPDVYIIILDSYMRSDVLQTTFGVDNQPFIDALTDLGFYVAPCSMSNYAYTPLSIASILNMTYIDQLKDYLAPLTDRTPLFGLIQHNAVRTNFESLGYKTVSIISYEPLKWDDADYYFPTDPDTLRAQQSAPFLSQFERMLGRNTALKILLDQPILTSQSDEIPANYPYADHVRQQRYILHQFQEIITYRGPKLVFVHINIPHPPYAFNADGTLIENPPPLPWLVPLAWDDYVKYYSGQVQYITSAILPILTEIVESSDPAPIIVIQGDHGGDSANRLGILNAYYAPDSVIQQLYPNITPVNSFRIIFNEVFGADYAILPDASYLSTQQEFYNFTLFEETMPSCKP